MVGALWERDDRVTDRRLVDSIEVRDALARHGMTVDEFEAAAIAAALADVIDLRPEPGREDAAAGAAPQLAP